MRYLASTRVRQSPALLLPFLFEYSPACGLFQNTADIISSVYVLSLFLGLYMSVEGLVVLYTDRILCIDATYLYPKGINNFLLVSHP